MKLILITGVIIFILLVFALGMLTAFWLLIGNNRDNPQCGNNLEEVNYLKSKQQRDYERMRIENFKDIRAFESYPGNTSI